MNLKLENFINKGTTSPVLQFLKLLSGHELQQKFLWAFETNILWKST